MTTQSTEATATFKVSYDMESEYEYRGRVYRIRVGAHQINSSKSYFSSVVRCIGTVMHEREFHDFPSQEAVEHFSKLFEVRLVGGAYSEDFSSVLYDGKQGALCEDDHSVYLVDHAHKFTGFDRLRCKAA